MPGAADALHARRHAGRRFDLDHEVDGAHVDAQLQAAGGDDAPELAGLQRVLDLLALLFGDRAVMGFDQVFFGELVEARGQPFRQPPGVDEHDGAAVALDQLQEPRVDGRPDRLSGQDLVGHHLGRVSLQVAHVLDGHFDRDLQRLAAAGVDDGDLARGAGQELAHLFQRALGRAKADALRIFRRQCAQAFQAQGQVGAALGGGDRVDLVDDHRLDGAQGFRGLLVRIRRAALVSRRKSDSGVVIRMSGGWRSI